MASRICSVIDCEKSVWCNGMCRLHNARAHKEKLAAQATKCNNTSCVKKAEVKGLCGACYQRQHNYGRLEYERAPPGEGVRADGYVIITVDGHQISEHVYVAEKALGRKLPKGAQVHHIDENKANNIGTNLVICPSQAYHMLIHKRMRDLNISFND